MRQAPKTVIVSASCDGAYGHPREIELLQSRRGRMYARSNGFRWDGNDGSFQTGDPIPLDGKQAVVLAGILDSDPGFPLTGLMLHEGVQLTTESWNCIAEIEQGRGTDWHRVVIAEDFLRLDNYHA